MAFRDSRPSVVAAESAGASRTTADNQKESNMRAAALSLVLTLALSIGFTSPDASAETPVGSNVDIRTVVNVKVAEAEAQKWLTAPWQVHPAASGPAKGANFVLVFYDRLLNQDPGGKPAAGGMDRALALIVPAKHQQSDEVAGYVVRVWTANPQALPGPYKNSVRASVRLEQAIRATDMEPASITERWEVRDTSGGVVNLELQYARGAPSRVKSEARVHGGRDPNFFQIFRVDSGSDVLRSVPAGIDRVERYQLRVTMADLRKAFDGSEQLVSVMAIPWYVRSVALP
jgi:hypothetical protein